MKNKKYVNGLLISLLSLTGCVFDSSSSTSSINSNNSAVSTSSSSVSSSTNDTKKENYFNSSDTELLEDYFGFVLPSIDLEYSLEDYSEELGYTCVIICYDNATEDDFIAYRELLGEEYTFVQEGLYESDYWYIYQEGTFSIETCYDDYSDNVPFIYLQIYDTNESDDSEENDDIEIKETVNGYFNNEDSALLDSYFDFKTPCVGDYYSLIDGTEYSMVDIYILFLYVTEDDFTKLQTELAKFSEFDETYYDEDYGLTWYYYSTDAFYIDIFFDDSIPEETYIYMNIYDPAWIEY